MANRAVWLDGAMGTALIAAGLPMDEVAERWNVDWPELVTAVHHTYITAGAEVILTNSLGANRLRLGREADALALAAAQVARAAAHPDVVTVAGAMGPVDPMASADVRRLAYRAQGEGLVAGGVDWLWLETFVSAGEAALALTAVAPLGLPRVVTFHFGPDGRTAEGEDAAAVVASLAGYDLLALGANCGQGPAAMVPVIAALRAEAPAGLPIVAKPNAGLPRRRGNEWRYSVAPASFAPGMMALHEAGAAWLGGCCGTTAEHLVAARAALEDAH